MLLLPIVRNISVRPVHVYTRLTPETLSMSSTQADLNLYRADPSALLYYDIRVKLIRCEADAPPRLKKIPGSSSDTSTGTSPSLRCEESQPLMSIEPSQSLAQSIPLPPPAQAALPISPAAPIQPSPPTSTLFSIGAIIGSLYYGANSSQATVTQSTLGKEDQDKVIRTTPPHPFPLLLCISSAYRP
jgi:hypothetical protein